MTQKASKTGKRLQLAKGLRFTCGTCGDCCQDFPVSLTPAEVERYQDRDWTDVLGAPLPAINTVRSGRIVTHYLRRRLDGACLFLDDDMLCKIHKTYGSEDKPLSCRAYPFAFQGEAERARVGVHFTCSSIAAGDGERVMPRDEGLACLVEEVEAAGLLPATPEQVPFQYALDYPQDETEFFLDLVVKELEQAGRPFPQRILAVAKFISLVANSRFPTLGTKTAKKQVAAFASGIRVQVERNLLKPPTNRPSLPQRLMFRFLLAFAARRDRAKLVTAGPIRRAFARVGNLLAGLAFMAGTGALRPAGRKGRVVLGEVRRKAPPADPAAPEADGALTRYFVAKLSSHSFFAPEFRMRYLLTSLGLLLRQYPIILLFARAACYERNGQSLSRDDYASALRTADRNFGHIAWDTGFFGAVRANVLAEIEETFTLIPWCAGTLAPPEQADSESLA